MKRVLLAACAVALTVGGLSPVGVSPAVAARASAGTATAYGANANLGGTPLIGQAGLATATLPPGQDVGPNSLLLVPAAPVAVSGTAVGQSSIHPNSDLPTTLEQVTQTTAGPYNARAVGLVEGLDVLAGAPNPIPGLPDLGVSVVSADAVRGEAVGVCRAGQAVYSSTSEVVNLKIGGTPVGLNQPVQQLVDALDNLLQPLSMVADIKRNEVVTNATGTAVNGLHVTVLGGIGVPATTPVIDLVVAHAQVNGLACPPAQCADTVDNDNDGLIDAKDPGCTGPDGNYDPNDDDERNQCTDGIDNDGDGKVDFGNDPGCSSPQDNDETDGTAVSGTGASAGGSGLARTGGDFSTSAPLAFGMSAIALTVVGIRRRSRA
jgi:hypothetical protein